MNSLFINETALHTRLLPLLPQPLLQAERGLRGAGCRFLPPSDRSEALVSESLLGTRWPQPVSETGRRARAGRSSERARRGNGEPALTTTSVRALPPSPGLGLLRPGQPPSPPKGVPDSPPRASRPAPPPR